MLAYIDPGAGSVIVSAIVAGLAGVGVFLRVIWRRIRHPLGGRRPESPDDTSQARSTGA
jgi:hypothetical protein